MKNRKLMAAAIILATFGSVSANTHDEKFKLDPIKNIKVEEYTKLKFKISLLNNETGIAQLRILNDTGEEVYSDNIDAKLLAKKLFDLSNLMDGKYTFLIRINGTTEKQIVNLKTETNRMAYMPVN